MIFWLAPLKFSKHRLVRSGTAGGGRETNSRNQRTQDGREVAVAGECLTALWKGYREWEEKAYAAQRQGCPKHPVWFPFVRPVFNRLGRITA